MMRRLPSVIVMMVAASLLTGGAADAAQATLICPATGTGSFVA